MEFDHFLDVYANISSIYPRQSVTQWLGDSFRIAYRQGLQACLVLFAYFWSNFTQRSNPLLQHCAQLYLEKENANLETGFMLESITGYRSIIPLVIIGQSISDSTNCNLLQRQLFLSYYATPCWLSQPRLALLDIIVP